MTDLQDALDAPPEDRWYLSKHRKALMAAARKVANLTRETQYGTCSLCHNDAPTPHKSDAPLEERWVSDWTPAGIDSEDTPT